MLEILAIFDQAYGVLCTVLLMYLDGTLYESRHSFCRPVGQQSIQRILLSQGPGCIVYEGLRDLDLLILHPVYLLILLARRNNELLLASHLGPSIGVRNHTGPRPIPSTSLYSIDASKCCTRFLSRRIPLRHLLGEKVDWGSEMGVDCIIEVRKRLNR